MGPMKKFAIPSLYHLYVQNATAQVVCRTSRLFKRFIQEPQLLGFAEVQNFTIGADVNGTKGNRAKLDFC